jgi:hypothetical protein
MQKMFLWIYCAAWKARNTSELLDLHGKAQDNEIRETIRGAESEADIRETEDNSIVQDIT